MTLKRQPMKNMKKLQITSCDNKNVDIQDQGSETNKESEGETHLWKSRNVLFADKANNLVFPAKPGFFLISVAEDKRGSKWTRRG